MSFLIKSFCCIFCGLQLGDYKDDRGIPSPFAFSREEEVFVASGGLYCVVGWNGPSGNGMDLSMGLCCVVG